jgi:4-amino-4-deoxy-L-arabinose transferase-like glycosyltransferase
MRHNSAQRAHLVRQQSRLGPIVAFAIRQNLTTRLWLLYALASASFVTTLGLPYIGEEGVYTITSLEMWLSHNFLVSTLYGGIYGRPPLYNWLIAPVAVVFGWDHVLAAARFVTAMSSVLTGLVLGWMTTRLTGDRRLAALAALIFLSGDVLFYHGWLAYSDPLFSLFIFSAIACLWVGVRENRPALFWLAVLATTCAFLTKVLTAYLFYALALLVLGARREYRARLLRPWPIAAHVAGVAAFLAWHYVVTGGGSLSDTAHHVLHKSNTVDLGDYVRQLALFPVETLVRLLPASALAAWFWYRQRRRLAPDSVTTDGFPLATLVWLIALNWLPYWLGPRSNVRYILPLYPLFALLLAWLISRTGALRVNHTVHWLAAAIALKYVFGLWAFPMHQQKFRGDQIAAAAHIEQLSQGFPLYANDDSATGLAVTARIDEHRYPSAPLVRPPQAWIDGFVLNYAPDPALGQVAEVVSLRNDKIYLLCRGAACR